MKAANKKYSKIMSLTKIRKLNILKKKIINKQVKVAQVAEEDEAMVPVYHESIHELLVQIGLKERFLQISSNNLKFSGTALTRLKNIMEYFGLKLPTKDDVISFFLGNYVRILVFLHFNTNAG